ncbi:carboxylesterase family protein [Nocardioides zeae]|uniref:Carboxylic ester hydrolase n=1 Tax=Nocardioides imazamoxiresistens TaxID=3231893 RepID=A0ABU3PSE6_9ACTN|nr:carboxylesterase family protein [Nocardioides zeae]MDT9592160.1 carboxylesterase family protein [Nocardioides zeae]
MDVDVVIAQGRVTGTRAGGVSVFRGVSYAAAPRGPLRFAAPAPPPRGDVDARAWGATVATPPQRSPEIDALLPDPVRAGDQPLNVNVWTPDPAARLPVLVWVHGGGFVTGAGSITAYDGAALARGGVVVVTFNYRLAVEGFVALGGAPANRGLRDQLAALAWVQDNIGAFGGDPDRVTLAGESAGAMAVVTLLSAPGAAGLFHRAVAQSGAGHHVHTPDEAAVVAELLGRELGVPPTAEAVGAVAEADVHGALNRVLGTVAAGREPGTAPLRRLGVQPVVDGEVLPARPVDALRAGAGADVDLLIGTNADEYGLFVTATGLDARLDEAALTGLVRRLGPDVAGLLPAYRERHPGATPADLYRRLQADWFFRVPQLRALAARHDTAGAGRTYAYEFAWSPATFDGRLGACHTLEVPLVFDSVDDPWGRALRGEVPRPVVEVVHGAWRRFVVDGDPGWPEHGPEQRVGVLTDRVDVVDDPYRWTADLWAGLALS